MKKNWWKEITELYHAALELPENEREAFLDACENEDLRREVSSLLANEGKADSLLEASALDAATRTEARESSSLIGTQLKYYQIISELGKGGMGEVYQAKDLKLGRDVAIKVLPEELAQDSDRVARFQREAKLLASLNHPNIAAIYGLEESDDTHFLVMELIEGNTLAGRIRAGPIPVEEALKQALQIAEALEVAHKKGIVHRDLKPSNIMVSDEGTVKLLDFSLAKLYKQDQPLSNLTTEDFPATQTGAILGTVSYMSPEQAQGQPADVRSDIFSFGLVLYEMLSGRRAFSRDSASETIAALLRDEPAPLENSPQLENIVKRCLEKKPSERHQTMSELKRALEKLVGKKVTISSEEPQPSIAVLPFVNMSGDKEQEYFSDGLAEEIINALTQIPKLKVIARTSAFAFKGKDQDITKIAEALRVSNILEGSVRKSGNRLRVTAQLINASDGSHLWSERYDREMTDVFAIQDEISQVISEKLRVHLSGDRPLVKRHTENIEAYNLYLKGRFNFYRSTQEGSAKSKEYYERAVAMDPNYALAWYGIAKHYWSLGVSGYMDPRVANAQSMKNVLKALELDEMLPEAHAMVGVLRAMEFNWKEAERKFNRSLELDPKSEEVWINYAWSYLVPLKRIDEAISAWKSTMELDPLSSNRQYFLGQWYYCLRLWDLAAEQYRYALELDPLNGAAHLMLGHTYIQQGKRDVAIQSLEKSIQVAGLMPLFMGSVGMAYGILGFKDKAQKLLEELRKLQKKAYAPSYSFALIYFGLGEIDKAFDMFERTADEHNGLIFAVPTFAYFDPLRSHPRYKVLLRRMNLEA